MGESFGGQDTASKGKTDLVKQALIQLKQDTDLLYDVIYQAYFLELKDKEIAEILKKAPEAVRVAKTSACFCFSTSANIAVVQQSA